jgi:hypothetical protein
MKGCDEGGEREGTARRASPAIERLFAEAIRAAIPAEGEAQDEEAVKEETEGGRGAQPE